MKNHAITLTHRESGYRNTYKVTRYIPEAQRKPALRFTYKELLEALPLSTYTHTIWFALLTWPIFSTMAVAVTQVAIDRNLIGPENTWVEKILQLTAFVFTAAILAMATFSKEGKIVRRRARANYLKKLLKKPHIILTEEGENYRICRLAYFRAQEIEKASTTLIPKSTYEKLESLQK